MADGSVLIDAKLNTSPVEKGLASMKKLFSGSGIAKAGKAAFTGITTAVTAAGAALTAMGGFAVKTGMEFDTAMSQVAATMGKSVDEIGAMRDAAIQYGASTAFSATEAAEALNYLALAGYDAEKAVDVLPSVLDLAAAGGMDLAYASDLVTDAMAALGVEATSENVTAFGDKMAKTASKANTSVAQLGEAILTVGGTAKSLAGGTSELNTALGVLANRGIKGSEGGTALRNVIMSLTAPTDIARKAMKKLGIQIEDTETGKMRPLNEIMADFNKKTEGMSVAAKNDYLSKIFNKTDLAAVQALMAGCGEEWDLLYEAIENADGAMSDMAKTQLDNLEGDVENLTGALESLGIAAYDKVKEPMREIVQLGEAMVVKLTKAMTDEGFTGFASALGGVLAEAVTKLSGYAPKIAEMGVSVVKALVAGIAANADTIAVVMADVFSTLATGIIEMLPDIISAAATLFAALVSKLPEIGTAMWEAIKQIDWAALGLSVMTSLLTALTPLGTELLSIFGTSAEQIAAIDWSTIGTSIMGGIGTISEWFTGLFTTGKEGAEGLEWSAVGTSIANGVGTVLDASGVFLSNIFSAGAELIKALPWTETMQVIGNAVTSVVDIGGAFLSGGFEAGITAVKTLDWAGIGTTISTAFNGIVDTTGAFLSGGFTAAQTAIAGIDWAGLGSTIGSSFNDLVDTTGAFLSAGFTAAQSTISAIDWVGMGTTIGNAFNDVIDTTGAFISGGFETAKTTIETIDWVGIGTNIGSAFNNIIDTTGAFISGGFTAAQTTIETIDWAGIGTTISTAFNGIVDTTGDFLAGGFEAAQTTIQGIDWAGIGKGITDNLNAAVEAVSAIGVGFWNTVKDWFTPDEADSADAEQAGKDISGSIATGIEAEQPTIESAATNAANAVITAFETALGSSGGGSSTKTKTIGENAVSGITDGIDAKAVESTFSACATSVFTALNTAIGTAFGSGDGGSATKFSPAGEGVITAITEGITNKAVEGTFSACAGSACTALQTALNSAFGSSDGSSAIKFKYIGEGVVQGVVDGINAKAVHSTFSAAAGRIASAVKSALESACSKSTWAYIGAMICEGVASGISSNSGKIASAAQSAARKAYNAAKSELGINSPSKSFAELGMYCMEGLVVGIEDNSDDFINAYRHVLDNAKRYAADSDILNAAADRMRLAFDAQTSVGDDGDDPKRGGIDYTELARAVWEEMPEDFAINQTVNFNQPVKTPDETARELRYNNTQGLVGGNH